MLTKETPFQELIVKINNIERRLMQTKSVFTFDEAAEFTGLTKSYLYKLTSANKIPFYKPNGKIIYFNREELENWLLQNRQSTHLELDTKAATYVSTH